MAPQSDMMDIVQLAVRETIKNELSLKVSDYYDGSVEIQLKLGEEEIGDPIYINVHTTDEHRHNFDHITSVRLEGS